VTAHSMHRLAAGGIAVLAGVVGVALLVQTGAGPACAAPPTGARKGKATFYDMGGGTGNCSFPSLPGDDLFVALGDAEYAGAAACGMYLDVTGPKGTVRVKVVDSCPPCAPRHIDLSRTAFGRIADHVTGVVPVTYRAAANPPVSGPLRLRVEGGSSEYWFAFTVDNHGNPLRSVQVRTGGSGSWTTADRQDHNVWVVDDGAGTGPFSVRMTDVYGRRATATGVKLAPGTTQRLSARFGGAAAGPEKTTVPASKSPSPSASTPSPSPSSPSPSLSPSASAAPIEPACGRGDSNPYALAGTGT
jgi:expansin